MQGHSNAPKGSGSAAPWPPAIPGVTDTASSTTTSTIPSRKSCIADSALGLPDINGHSERPPGDVADESPYLFQVFYNTLFSKRREVDFKSGRKTTTILSQLLNRSDFSPENSVPHVSYRFGMGTPVHGQRGAGGELVSMQHVSVLRARCLVRARAARSHICAHSRMFTCAQACADHGTYSHLHAQAQRA